MAPRGLPRPPPQLHFPTLLLAAALLLAAGAPAPAAAVPTPVAQFLFEGSLADSNVTGPVWTAATGTVAYVAGQVGHGQAVYFNNPSGAAALTTALTLSSTAFAIPGAWTVTCWTKPVNATVPSYEQFVWTTSPYVMHGMGLGYHPGGSIYTYNVGGPEIATPINVPLQGWHHSAVVVSNLGGTGTGNITFYVDGALVGSLSSSTLATTQTGIYLGRDSTQPNQAYQGAVDDFRIYNSALSAADVAAVYAEGLPVFQASSGSESAEVWARIAAMNSIRATQKATSHKRLAQVMAAAVVVKARVKALTRRS